MSPLRPQWHKTKNQQKDNLKIPKLQRLGFFSFLSFAAPMEYGSSWASDWIQAVAVTYATIVATPDP